MESIKDWIAPLISRIDKDNGGYSPTIVISGKTGYCCQLQKASLLFFLTFRSAESPQEELHATANDAQHHINLVFDVVETNRWEAELKDLAPKERRDLTQYQRATFALQSFEMRMESRKTGQLPRVFLYVKKWHICGSSDETLYYPDVKEFGDSDDNDAGRNATVVISRWWNGGVISSPVSPSKATIGNSSLDHEDGQEKEIIGYQRPGKWSTENATAICAAYGPGILDAGVAGNGDGDGPPRRQSQPYARWSPQDTISAGPSGSGPLVQEERVASLPTPPREPQTLNVSAVIPSPTSLSLPVQPRKRQSVSPSRRITDVFAPTLPASSQPASPSAGDADSGSTSSQGHNVLPYSPIPLSSAPPSSSPLPSASAVQAIRRAAAEVAPSLPPSSPLFSQPSSPSHYTQPGSRIQKQNGLQQKWDSGPLAQARGKAREQAVERYDYVDEEDESEDDGNEMEIKAAFGERAILPNSQSGKQDVRRLSPTKRQKDPDATPRSKRKRLAMEHVSDRLRAEAERDNDESQGKEDNRGSKGKAYEEEEEVGGHQTDGEDEEEDMEEEERGDSDFAGSKTKTQSPILFKPVPKVNGFRLDMFLRFGGLTEEYARKALEQAEKKRREQRRKSGPV
ncbi:hypothetical protein L198_03155 [Cryptococcus wingfieldii CBS 7118]|uniref:Telomere replication protein EST3 n=1 Tax=Cryptococcus wingfieldii CBS 7118 TaxID=1295528 RepID=A0A1E3JIZ8_9TREE|nr:hypothetical protein L198_03155 [Cryptococcus wingfieldii CBS 7118]ODO00828.1 hypothetical protein L198_03155 [Cryptococcus wingfieldii CBS 7118]